MADMANAVWRGFSAAFGICAITWAIFVFPAFRAELPLVDAAERFLSGDKFNVAQMGALRSRLQAASTDRLPTPAQSSAAVIRLMLLEDEWRVSNGKLPAADVAEFQRVVDAVLAQSPTSSFLWLVDVWLERLRSEGRHIDLNLLRMSYWSGPNEAWIAVRRNPLALSVFSSLPNELAEQAVSEFAGLVGARLYAQAADILAGPGWAIHERLLSRLVDVDEDNRRAFARALATKDLEGVTVPGVSERPFRRF